MAVNIACKILKNLFEQEPEKNPVVSDIKTTETVPDFISKPLDFARVKQEFEDTFEKEFDEAYGKFRAYADGELIYPRDLYDELSDKGKETFRALLPKVNVMGFNVSTGEIAATALTLTDYIRKYKRDQKAQLICELFSAIRPRERTDLIHWLAEQIFLRYQNQLLNLASGQNGVSFFATCSAARIIDYIMSDKSHQIESKPSHLQEIWRWMKSGITGKELASELEIKKSFDDIFLHGLSKVKSNFGGENKTLQTHSTVSDQWKAKGIFENTGIIDEKGVRWADPQCRLDDYGYCNGTAYEAKKIRGFSSKDKNESVWPRGRDWTKISQQKTSVLTSATQRGLGTFKPVAASQGEQHPQTQDTSNSR